MNTVGEYSVEPGYTVYPPPSAGHPDDYYFNVDRGRILDNYQLIYITQGRGWYRDTPGGEALEIRAGTMLIIPPYTWHSYCPDHRTGWHEYWIGFRGEHVDDRYNNGFFSRGRIIHPIGLREHIIDQYREALDIALREKTGSQQVLASIANIILSYVIYYDLNDTGRDIVAEKMDRARSIMRENMLAGITPEEVAGRINMSYSWFRKTFKEYTNVSPAHYIMQLRLRKAKAHVAQLVAERQGDRLRACVTRIRPTSRRSSRSTSAARPPSTGPDASPARRRAGRRLLHVKQLGKFLADGCIVRLDDNDVGHVVPPAAHQRVVGHLLRTGPAAGFLHGEQRVGGPVEEDRVVVHALFAEPGVPVRAISRRVGGGIPPPCPV